jgi:hypothetical protein
VRGGIRRGKTESSNQSTLSALAPPGAMGEARPGGEFRPTEGLLGATQRPADAPSGPALPY